MPSSSTPPPLSGEQFKQSSAQMFNSIKVFQGYGDYFSVIINAGYVIEFALKALICKALGCVYPYPPDIRYRTHDINKLIQLSGLEVELRNKLSLSTEFLVNWSLLSDWSPEFRYKPVDSVTKADAEDYINALEHLTDGVYIWIQSIW